MVSGSGPSRIPLYTRGLRLLWDGLSALEQHYKENAKADRELNEVRTAFDTVRPYAAAAIWQSPFTCFSGTHPDDPQLAGASTRSGKPVAALRETDWENIPATRSLDDSLKTFNWKRCETLCDALVERLDKLHESFPIRNATEILSMLRRKRRFRLMERVAAAILRLDPNAPKIRRRMDRR